VTRWLDDEEMAAWRGMVEVQAALEAELEADLLASHGLSLGDYGVLVSLSEAPDERMRMCDLAGRLQLSPSGLTRRLDGLVRQGLVVREPSDDDRRVILARLTPEGRSRLEAAAPVHVEGVRRRFLDHLSRSQIAALAGAFAAAQRGRAEAADRPALQDAS
jgi:DNA-binding MarR family transcriptional regulator